MSFLKKLGLIAAQIGATAVGLGPIITPLFGNKADKATQIIGSISNDLTAIATVIAQMEIALAGKAGTEKFAAAVALVGPIIRTSQLATGKKIADPALLQKGIEGVTQGMVDVLNSFSEESVKTEVKVSQ